MPFGFSRENIAPGETVRAVIVPPVPTMLSAWEVVVPGNLLKLYEGPSIKGTAVVLWRAATTLPPSYLDAQRFTSWLASEAD